MPPFYEHVFGLSTVRIARRHAARAGPDVAVL